MADEGPIRLVNSQMEVVELQGRDEFLACADDLDPLYLSLYGESYPHLARDEFKTVGPNSRGVAVYHDGLLVAFCAYVHEEQDCRIEVGRMLRHPNYRFDMMVVAEPLTRYMVELSVVEDVLFYATTRIWVTSYYMELIDFDISGSLVYPVWSTSTWGGDELIYPFLGIYIHCPEIRAARTAAIPQWVQRTFHDWAPVFNRYEYSPQTFVEPIELDITEFPHKPDTNGMCPGEVAWVPCVDNDQVAQRVEELVQRGHVLMAFLPGWKRVKSGNGVTYVSYLVLEQSSNDFASFPDHFGLSQGHFDFTCAYHRNTEGQHCFYRQSLKRLFYPKQLPLTRRLLLRIYARFNRTRVYNLLCEEHDTEQAVAHIFPPSKLEANGRTERRRG